jgi:hypothetical protein
LGIGLPRRDPTIQFVPMRLRDLQGLDLGGDAVPDLFDEAHSLRNAHSIDPQ